MRKMIWTNKANVVNNQKISAFINPGKRSADLNESNPFSEILTTEGCELRSSSSASQKVNSTNK